MLFTWRCFGVFGINFCARGIVRGTERIMKTILVFPPSPLSVDPIPSQVLSTRGDLIIHCPDHSKKIDYLD